VSERLTKTELGWLLAQEARSAAQKLRVGVGIAPPESIPPPPIIEEGTGGVEGTLNRLDEAVSMLASLHGQPMYRGRRGKIDIAALLWEVAPEARVSLEMGEGTNVFGDESELRRMLHVLLAHSGDPTGATAVTSAVSIRREKEEVKVGVSLGPDKPATFETERAWLARMATRYGGRLELDGAMHTLVLPADVDTHRRELDRLQKELAAAQAQGEAYARELAAVFQSESRPGTISSAAPPMTARPSHMPASGDGLNVLVAAVRAIGSEMRGILSAIGRDIAPLRDTAGESGEIAASVGRHVTAASEVVSDLTRLGSCPIGELPRLTNVAELIRDVVQSDVVRAARHDVRIVVDAPETADEVAPSGALTVLLHALLDHAISASPAGSEVVVTVFEDPSTLWIAFDDAGSPLPASARSGVLSREFEIIAQGRPTGVPLIAAYSIAANLRLPLDIEEGPKGGTRVRLTLPRGPVSI
jgi:two-component system, OmpR family, sensor kinase